MHRADTRTKRQLPTTPIAAERARPRVLLADDDPEARWLVSSMLSDEGCEVVEAEDGKRMIDAVRTAARGRLGGVEPFDLILADIRMPFWSGLDFLAVLRRFDWSTPVCLMTAYGGARYLEPARRLGAFGVFEKPLGLTTLRNLLTQLVPRGAG